MLDVTFSILLWPQLNWFSMCIARYSFVSNFLKRNINHLFERSNLKMSLICSYLLPIYSFITLAKFGLIKSDFDKN